MAFRVDAKEAQRLMADGTPVLDVLPAAIYQQEHLPGAVNVPLETFEPSAVDWLDRAAPVVVYCFDQHCDLSARASCRLDALGFEAVHDLIGGRAAWTALGFPTEGAVGDRRRISHYATAVKSVSVTGTIADVQAATDGRFPVPVTSDGGVLLGAVQPVAAGLPPSTPVEYAMVPAPGTIRPELRIEEVVSRLRRDGLDHVFVTGVDGMLIGRVVTEELRA